MGIDTGALNIDAFANTFENNMPGQNPTSVQQLMVLIMMVLLITVETKTVLIQILTQEIIIIPMVVQGSYHDTGQNNGGQDFVNNNGRNTGSQNNDGQSMIS